jgi:hypothetical protein
LAFKDLSSLPIAEQHAEPPAKKPVFGPLLAQAWADQFVNTEEHPVDLPMAGPSARIRHSWAGMCARRIGYSMLEVEPSNPLQLSDHWRFGLGHAVHDAWQKALCVALPGYEIEVKVFLEDGLLAGHCDAVGPAPKKPEDLVTLELKTINGYGFKKAVGARGPADGPRLSAKLQGALNAKAAGSEWLVIVYTSLENLSVREAKKGGFDDIGRFCAEWRYPREVWEPWADAEQERLLNIIGTVDAGLLPERRIPDPEIPEDALIVDPSSGLWQVIDPLTGGVADGGSFWGCSYCPFQDSCVRDIKEERLAA